MKKSTNLDRITLGVCYYPEHWRSDLWESDLQRMKEHGISVIRIAEFAWNKFEPEEGVYTFDFFDEFMEVASKQDMKVIFCTPTATPPAWMSQKYPEILNADINGVLYRHGQRRHYSYNSPVYREFTRVIVEKLAEHYCSHPSIIGWQIDNELNCETDKFYSESDHKAFREFLKDKYKTLDSLNDKWGTIFWNQTYTAWEEIYLSRPTVSKSPNPHLALDEARFVSYSAISFCRLQSDIIDKYRPEGQFITTNGLFNRLDYNEMVDKSLDFIMYDSYPNFAFGMEASPKTEGNLNDRKWGWNLTKTRSISPNFGIMEQQSGPNGWTTRLEAPAPKPGQMRLWTMQSISHGADFVSYFRWRTCWVGTEIYWHGLLDYSNRDNRRLKELKLINQDIIKLADLAGSKYKAAFAILKDYSNEWDAEFDRWHQRVDEVSDNGWFAAAQITHTPCDFFYLRQSTSLDELKKYPLLVYPHAVILNDETVALLRQYVEEGGILVMGCRTGYKDDYGRCPMVPMPGPARDLCGADVVDFTFVGPYDEMEKIKWGSDDLEAPVFNDILEPLNQDAVVEGVYKGNYYDGKPALISSKVGKGRAYYYGGAFSKQTAEIFLNKLGLSNPYSDIIELPEECEIAVREKEGKRFIFILNYKEYPVNIIIKKKMYNVLESVDIKGETAVDKYGVLVLSNNHYF